MGFVSLGTPLTRVRRHQKAINNAYLRRMQRERRSPSQQKPREDSPAAPESIAAVSTARMPKVDVLLHLIPPRVPPTLVDLPAEVLETIFIYSLNADMPLVCRRFAALLRSSSKYLQLRVLSQYFALLHTDVGAPPPAPSIYDRRFVTAQLLRTAKNEGYVENPAGAQLSEKLSAPPYTLHKLRLLEYLLIRGAAPVNPRNAVFMLAENCYEHPDSDENGDESEEEEEDNIDDVQQNSDKDRTPVTDKVTPADVYREAKILPRATMRQRMLALLIRFSIHLELEPEVTDALFSANEYGIVLYAIRHGAVDTQDPELWERATCRGDQKAMEFLYGVSD
ncbi:uncharacterized protein V1518DRAFT_430775 [Limtongia smithiae]|uniref:uncharacterized protein n=1 Tax=Limtongia smithiae TaxID=1125753 RepID=UPI0034CF9C71